MPIHWDTRDSLAAEAVAGLTNPTYSRTAQITVVVDHQWLTQDGELDPAESWREIAETLTKHLHRAVPWPEVKIEFEEWESEPKIQGEQL